jgi:hypothetical protein
MVKPLLRGVSCWGSGVPSSWGNAQVTNKTPIAVANKVSMQAMKPLGITFFGCVEKSTGYDQLGNDNNKSGYKIALS